MTNHPFPITPEHYLSLWIDAAKSELGIVIPIQSSDDIQHIIHSLYEARKDISDPRLIGLSIHVLEDGSAILIYKKEVELDD